LRRKWKNYTGSVVMPEKWIPIRWCKQKDYDEYNSHIVIIEQMNSPYYKGDSYAVRDGSMCLNILGQWEYETSPSSRDDSFYERCRFKTLEEAVKCLEKSKK
jgi:hypothetical protein